MRIPDSVKFLTGALYNARPDQTRKFRINHVNCRSATLCRWQVWRRPIASCCVSPCNIDEDGPLVSPSLQPWHLHYMYLAVCVWVVLNIYFFGWQTVETLFFKLPFYLSLSDQYCIPNTDIHCQNIAKNLSNSASMLPDFFFVNIMGSRKYIAWLTGAP